MTQRYLVTGASGFIGWHLVDRLARAGEQVFAWCHENRNDWSGEGVVLEHVDVRNLQSVARAFSAADPDIVFHLAARSLPMGSWAEPAETFRVNVEGTLNLLETVRKQSNKPRRVLVASSSGIYASQPDGAPIAEESTIEPGSPYAVSKSASDQLSDLYVRAFDMDIIRFRPFSWIGTHKTGDVVSDLARRIVSIERGGIPPRLLVGRTDTIRDIIDVRDGITALLELVEKGARSTAYNICSGRGVTIADLISIFKAHAETKFEVAQDPALLRPLDESIRIGDPSKMQNFGWCPEISLTQSIKDILDYWREKSSKS